MADNLKQIIFGDKHLTVGLNEKGMNRGLKLEKLKDEQVSLTNPSAATIKIFPNAQSKSVAIAAIAQPHNTR